MAIPCPMHDAVWPCSSPLCKYFLQQHAPTCNMAPVCIEVYVDCHLPCGGEYFQPDDSFDPFLYWDQLKEPKHIMCKCL